MTLPSEWLTEVRDIISAHGLNGVDALENTATSLTDKDCGGCGANYSAGEIAKVVADPIAVLDQVKKDLEDKNLD
jgi:hypothetical protein